MDRPLDPLSEASRNNLNAEAFMIATSLAKQQKILPERIRERMQIAGISAQRENTVFTVAEMSDPAIQKILKTVNQTERSAMLTALLLIDLGNGDLSPLEKAIQNANLSREFKADLLRFACKTKQTQIAFYLIAHGALLDHQDDAGETALHIACKMGQDRVVEKLLQNGASPNLPSKNLSMPIHFATQQGNEKIVALLLRHGADCNVVNQAGSSPLHNTVIRGNEPILRLLLQRRPNLNLRDNLGQTPLHYMIFQGNVAMMRALLAEGASAEVIDLSGRTPMHYAVINRKPEMVQVLRGARASCNVQDSLGNTPLHFAVIQNDLGMASRLIQEGTLLDIHDSMGRTPLHYAVANKNVPLVTLLIQAGANRNVQDQLGSTPLHLAVHGKDQNTTRFLLTHGANPNIQNMRGETPLHISVQKNDQEILNLLLDHDADPNYVDILGVTPFLGCLLSGLFLLGANLLRRGADESLAKELREAKMAAHVFGLKGYAHVTRKDGLKQIFQAEGLLAHVSARKLATSFKEFTDEYKDDPDMLSTKDLGEMQAALDASFPGNLRNQEDQQSMARLSSEIGDKIRKGETMMIMTGVPGHTINIVFCKDKIIVCNRGARYEEIASNSTEPPSGTASSEPSTASSAIPNQKIMVEAGVVYDYPHGEVSNGLVLSFLQEKQSLQEFQEQFTKVGLKQPSQEALEIPMNFQLKAQEAGICTWASSKTALLAMLREYCGHTKEGHERAYRIYKKYTAFVRKKTLESYIELLRQQGKDPEQNEVVRLLREKDAARKK